MKDKDDKCLRSYYKFLREKTNNQTEVEALTEGIGICINNGFQNIETEGDSKVAI